MAFPSLSQHRADSYSFFYENQEFSVGERRNESVDYLESFVKRNEELVAFRLWSRTLSRFLSDIGGVSLR